MYKQEIIKLIDVATKRKKADIVIKNAKIVDVYQSKIIEGDLAINDKYIVGIGNYEAKLEIDARGGYIIPGLIDSHIHIESTYLSPGEAGRMVVPHGTTTIIADPHEIVNCCGIDGLEYMLDATDNTVLDIKYMMPSCVPCTPFETSGAVITAKDMKIPFTSTKILGLGEMMDYVGVNAADEDVIAKIDEAKQAGKLIDGHAPGLSDELLNAYVSAGVHTDHECSSVKEMEDRLSRGMYVQLRQGSACRDLKYLIPGITKENSRYCILCSDDREPKTIIEQGHIDDHLRICVKEGIDPIVAVQMATINAAQCYRLHDRGGIAPGLLANIVIVDNLKDFEAQKVFIEGKLVAENGEYLKTFVKQDISKVSSAMNIKDFSMERLKLKYDSDEVVAMQTLNDGVLTKKIKVKIDRNENGEFLYNKKNGLNKIAVVERHKGTGNIGLGLIKGFGIKEGAIAQSIAHDSHNVMVVGMSDTDMTIAVERLSEVGGGIIVVKNGKILAELELPIAGLMSDKTGEEVKEKFDQIHEACHNELGIKEEEPIVTLSFMSLPVIPEIKITDKGLFDVTKFEFID